MLDVTAFLSTIDGGADCALASRSIPLNGDDLLCAIVKSGAYCWKSATQCFAPTCDSSTRKRALSERVVLPMTYAVSYRRVKAHSKSLRNSHEATCGPRFEFLVDGRTQFLSTERQFLSQGTLSFSANATVLPDNMSTYEFRVTPTECQHSKLLLWDEHILVASAPEAAVLVDDDTLNARKFANVDFK